MIQNIFLNIYVRLHNIVAGGLQSSDFHIVNILLHGIVCVVFITFSSITLSDGNSFMMQGASSFYSPYLSTISAVLFAIHPIHTESVCLINYGFHLFVMHAAL